LADGARPQKGRFEMERLKRGTLGLRDAVGARVACARGQGTTEYAILVGVLVVIAVVAVTSFRGKIQELWTLISEGINGL
jgi:Flp pilus assembly pilin Flp